MFLNLEQVI